MVRYCEWRTLQAGVGGLRSFSRASALGGSADLKQLASRLPACVRACGQNYPGSSFFKASNPAQRRSTGFSELLTVVGVIPGHLRLQS
ncbi:hypothetical protein NIES4075_00260 [Tolypothrix sp. NIES-4075]|nr:hypothetical protein NIES4075_00260 [Tolypothrix sp. NIES-4075]